MDNIKQAISGTLILAVLAVIIAVGAASFWQGQRAHNISANSNVQKSDAASKAAPADNPAAGDVEQYAEGDIAPEITDADIADFGKPIVDTDLFGGDLEEVDSAASKADPQKTIADEGEASPALVDDGTASPPDGPALPAADNRAADVTAGDIAAEIAPQP